MKSLNFLFTALLVLCLGFFMSSCSENDITGSKQSNPSTKFGLTGEQLDAFNAKQALLPTPAEKPIMARTPITYVASFCDDASYTYTHTTANSIGNSAAWDYYSFYAVAGEVVGINVVRSTCEMDPAFNLYSGTTTASDLSGMTGIGFWDDECSAGCVTCFAWGDPCFGGWVVATSGWYTVAVFDYLSCGGPGYNYTLNITGLEGDADGVCGDVDNCPSVFNEDQANCDGDSEGDACDSDDDNDGVADAVDVLDCSNTDPTVNIDGCDSGVDNYVFPDGTTMMDLILACADGAGNHGDFVSCVTHLTNEWKASGLISGSQKADIVSCAAQASW